MVGLGLRWFKTSRVELLQSALELALAEDRAWHHQILGIMVYGQAWSYGSIHTCWSYSWPINALSHDVDPA